MSVLKRKILEHFNMELVALELMNLIEEIDMTGKVLENFVNEKFEEDFMYGELYELFKDEVDKEDLKVLLEDMGHDFVDLDELEEEEREKNIFSKNSTIRKRYDIISM